jgi:hypothetical protein
VKKMGVLRGIKRIVLVSALAGALMYAGDTYGINKNLIGPLVNYSKPIEEGYPNPRDMSIESHANDAGKIEAYLVYSNGAEKQELPILKNSSGLQVGGKDYWWSNLAIEERNSFVVKGWNNLGMTEKTRIVTEEFRNLAEYAKIMLTIESWQQLSQERKGELVTQEWGRLEKNTKYPLVKSELEQALDAFYKQTGGGEKNGYSEGF